MLREMIDNYLDGALDASARSEVEKALLQDAAAKGLLAKIKSERAIRAAAYESYMPDGREAAALATRIMAACDDQALAPVGRVGNWRRYAAVAAMVAIAAGSFAMGRGTAPVTVVEAPADTKTVYNLAYTDGTGSPQVQVFDTLEERDRSFVDQLKQRSGFAQLADFASPGHM